MRHGRHISVLEPREGGRRPREGETEGRRRSRPMSLTQERKDNVIRRVGATTGEPDGPAVRPGTAMIDMTTGLYSTIGILAALQERETS